MFVKEIPLYNLNTRTWEYNLNSLESRDMDLSVNLNTKFREISSKNQYSNKRKNEIERKKNNFFRNSRNKETF